MHVGYAGFGVVRWTLGRLSIQVRTRLFRIWKLGQMLKSRLDCQTLLILIMLSLKLFITHEWHLDSDFLILGKLKNTRNGDIPGMRMWDLGSTENPLSGNEIWDFRRWIISDFFNLGIFSGPAIFFWWYFLTWKFLSPTYIKNFFQKLYFEQ